MSGRTILLGTLGVVAIGAAVGGYMYWDSLRPAILVDCKSSATVATCTFHNLGTATGSECVNVTLERKVEISDFILTSPDRAIRTQLLCSGRLEPGDSVVREVTGYFSPSTSQGVNGARFCAVKSKPGFQGCELGYESATRQRY